MAGTQLKNIINKYLGVPYFINTLQNPRQKLAAQVGKGNWRQIQAYTRKLAKAQNFKLTAQNTYGFQKKNHIGLDCSGLVYHLLNYLHPHFSSFGPRRLSARMLTSPPYSQPAKTAQVGDLIRTRQGKHVLFIYQVAKNKIFYVHSSRQGRGVRLGSFPQLPSSTTLHRPVCLTSPPPAPRT